MQDTMKVQENDITTMINSLSFWMTESQKQFSAIINSQGNSVTQGVKSLEQQVNQLLVEHEILKRDRILLFQTVENLNNEIKHYQRITKLSSKGYFKEVSNSEIELSHIKDKDKEEQLEGCNAKSDGPTCNKSNHNIKEDDFDIDPAIWDPEN